MKLMKLIKCITSHLQQKNKQKTYISFRHWLRSLVPYLHHRWGRSCRHWQWRNCRHRWWRCCCHWWWWRREIRWLWGLVVLHSSIQSLQGVILLGVTLQEG
jgi:hypothetical protein